MSADSPPKSSINYPYDSKR